ncbi:carboxypeptidase-like regulatory domain-containing protein [Mucilaginibacter sp. ZT4R22]|uniref:Carboxypeptidase-like regulatory domain-containing protein n=1 Tax=Mucilaginibacter pankratovii TaxID=2772110 RepID=A0ABR7WVT0_9SPHI|nr:carboxypeptidase-like regulatory domain-containing protein [Mucilaginibacter pankratovii]MBD1366400.1 carboxypeptidase-like regulatory domain-containing protein [Mucilaginibacter pankratovii]
MKSRKTCGKFDECEIVLITHCSYESRKAPLLWGFLLTTAMLILVNVFVEASERPQKNIINTPIPRLLSTQTFTLRGRALNKSTKLPLSDVKIRLKGTLNQVFTDSTGSFKLQVPPAATLIISCVGYSSRELPIGSPSGSPIEIYLQESTDYFISPVVVKSPPFYTRWWRKIKHIF